jgi:anaerobic magnesium-protoporphyrin IX monomethyl ester cyclase
MNVVLISPPVGNIGQAPPGISVLNTWLTSLGHRSVQWDLGIEAFEHVHSARNLEQVAAKLGGSGVVDRQPRGRETEMARVAETMAQSIEQARARLRSPGVESDLAAMVGSLETIRGAGSLISSAHGLCRFDYSRYDIPGAFASWENLRDAVTSRERNLLWDFFTERALPQLGRLEPDLVGISISYSSQLLAAFCLTWLIKNAYPTVPVLLGGSFLKAVQDDLRTMPTWVVPADGLCIGDGEPALQSYLEARQGRGDVSLTPNMLLPKEGSFVFSGTWQEVALDSCPVPMMDMEGLPLGSYLVPRYAIPLPISRGCYWRQCVFCNISNQARERYRSREAGRCVADIQALVDRYRTRWFDFPTDSVRPGDLEHLANGLLEAKVDIEWAAEVLLDPRLTDPVIELLARSGCRFLRFGLESACERTLKLMHKRIDLAEGSRILRSCRRAGIKTGAMLIVGFPTETQTELMQTMDYLLQRADDIDFVTLHPFTIAPGSRLAIRPELAGVHLLPRRGVLTPSLPYAHTNPVAMRPEDLPGVVDTLLDRLGEAFPQTGQLWASGIGGWLTFAACCANGPDFFKQPLPKSYLGAGAGRKRDS